MSGEERERFLISLSECIANFGGKNYVLVRRDLNAEDELVANVVRIDGVPVSCWGETACSRKEVSTSTQN